FVRGRTGEGTTVAGLADVELLIFDDSDPVDLVMAELDLGDGGSPIPIPLDATSFPGGSVDGLGSSTAGTRVSLVWNSGPTAPLRAGGLILRLQGSDAGGALSNVA